MRRLGEQPRLNLDQFAWANSNANVVKSFVCHIPKKIRDVVRSANTVLEKDEFSFLLKCDIDWKNNIVRVSEDWYFPKQVVTPGAVNYDEDNNEYNGVMHKHPGKLMTFSPTDDKWINQNFQVSILWINDEFCNGRINIPSQAGKIQLPMTLQVEPDFVVMEDVVDIVKEKASSPLPVTSGNGSGPLQPWNQLAGGVNFFPGFGNCDTTILGRDEYNMGDFLTETDGIPFVSSLSELDDMSDEEYAEACLNAARGTVIP